MAYRQIFWVLTVGCLSCKGPEITTTITLFRIRNCCKFPVHVQEKIERQKKGEKQWSTSTTQKTKDRTRRSPLKTGGELGCSGRVSSSCSTCGTLYRVTLVTNLMRSHEWGKDRVVIMTIGTYPWTFQTWILCVSRS